MAINNGFPPELLEQSTQKRLDYFKATDKTVAHQNLKVLYYKAHRTIVEPAGTSIILVIGPSGVGKSTLLRLLEKKILNESLAQMEINLGWVPIICVEADAPGRGTFRWKNFYKMVLLALDEPGINQKIDYGEESVRRNQEGKLIVGSRATEDSLRLAMKKALSHRRPYTLAVDEFQHIGIMANPSVLQAHLDCVKSVVNSTKIPWTGFGTYELLNFIELSPQLSRRTKVIHFPRYRLECNEELQEFKRVLEHFQYWMPLRQTPPLKQKYWEFCYERSIGKIGTLKDWLTDAYHLCLSEDATTLTLEHLEQTAKSSSECEQMANDAIEGEERLTDNTHKSKNLRILLGLEKHETQKAEEVLRGNSKQQKDGLSRSRKRRVGERNPKRDSVGGKSV